MMVMMMMTMMVMMTSDNKRESGEVIATHKTYALKLNKDNILL